MQCDHDGWQTAASCGVHAVNHMPAFSWLRVQLARIWRQSHASWAERKWWLGVISTSVQLGGRRCQDGADARWRAPNPRAMDSWVPKTLQSLKPPKAHTILKFTESTQALKARKRTRGPNEITIQKRAPRQYPGNTPSSKGSGMAPGPCLGAQRRKIRLFKTIDLGEVIYKELATRL